MHLPRIQEIKNTELLWQGFGKPLCVIHDVVMQVPAVGVEHLVLFMCRLDDERVAVSDWKRATSITQPAPLGRSHWASPSLNPAREDAVMEGDLERKEGILETVWGWETEMPVLECET